MEPQKVFSPPDWVTVSTPSFFTTHRGKIISAVALAILTSGGLLFYFQIHTVTSYILMGAGGALFVGNIIKSIKNRKIQSNYSVISWDVGTWENFKKTYTLNLLRQNKARDDAKEIVKKFYENPTYYIPFSTSDKITQTWNTPEHKQNLELYALRLLEQGVTPENIQFPLEVFCKKPEDYQTEIEAFRESMKRERETLFQTEFNIFLSPDIICLQESSEIDDEKWKTELLPKGYGFFSFKNNDDHPTHSAVAWKLEKFSLEKYACFSFQDTNLQNQAPDTIVLLRDKGTQATICVYSAYINGFNLAYRDLPEEKDKEVELSKAEAGDSKLKYALTAMDAIHADLNIVAGNFNATSEYYKRRFEIMKTHKYFTDTELETSKKRMTTYDANLRKDDTPMQVRYEHCYVAYSGQITNVVLNDVLGCTLGNFARPSDHLPIKMGIKFTIDRRRRRDAVEKSSESFQ